MKLLAGLVSIIAAFFVGNVYADPDWVFRVDSRSPTDIFENGFSAKGGNDGLVEHVSGNSVIDNTSAYVAVTDNWRVVTQLADSVIPEGSDDVFWVYTIRPTLDFYNVRASLVSQRNAHQGTRVGRQLSDLYQRYAWQAEWAARGGIATDNILGASSVRRLNGQIHIDPYMVQNRHFVDSPPEVNPNLLTANGSEYSENVYSVGEPRGFNYVSLSLGDCQQHKKLNANECVVHEETYREYEKKEIVRMIILL